MFFLEERPPPALLRKLLVIHREYGKKPLKSGTILDWKGPLFSPECVASLDNNANAFRQPLESLLSSSSPCNSSKDSTWELELIAPIAVGNYIERTSQVWRCDAWSDVQRGAKPVFQGKVVLKLYFEGCFPYYNTVNGQRAGDWMDEEGLAINEARA